MLYLPCNDKQYKDMPISILTLSLLFSPRWESDIYLNFVNIRKFCQIKQKCYVKKALTN